MTQIQLPEAAPGQYTSISIATAIDLVRADALVLPLIQRDFEWDIDRVTKLFDSVLQGYPINSMLFWDVPEEARHSVQMYRFIRNFTAFDYFEAGQVETEHGERHHNAAINPQDLPPKVWAILDGQQRLTSFYMGLCGTYAPKTYRTRYGNPDNYPPQALYLCVTDLASEVQTLEDYRTNHFKLEWQEVEWQENDPFSVLHEPFRHNNSGSELWLHMGEVLRGANQSATEWANLQLQGLRDYAAGLHQNQLAEDDFIQAAEALKKLHEAVHTTPYVSFYLDAGTSLARAVETFIRINSGGMVLGYTALLFSILNSEWKQNSGRTAREIIEELEGDLRRTDTGLDLEKGFILKSALVMVERKNLRFELGQFTSGRIRSMEEHWPLIDKALRAAALLVQNNRLYALNTNALLTVVAYYYYTRMVVLGETGLIPLSDERRITQWLIRARLRWSSEKYGTETKISRLLEVLTENVTATSPEFPFLAMTAKPWGIELRLSTDVDASDGIDIEALAVQSKDETTTRFLLGVLQKNVTPQVSYDVDHCYPFSEIYYTDNDEYIGHYNSLPNLQLLPDSMNRSKSDRPFHDWYQELDDLLALEANGPALGAKTQQELHQVHYYPSELPLAYAQSDSDQERLAKFDQFYHSRKSLVIEKLHKLLANPE